MWKFRRIWGDDQIVGPEKGEILNLNSRFEQNVNLKMGTCETWWGKVEVEFYQSWNRTQWDQTWAEEKSIRTQK